MRCLHQKAAILYNLKARHVRSLPYTRTGDIILACNPYQWFHDIYSEEVRERYSSALVWAAAAAKWTAKTATPSVEGGRAADTPSKARRGTAVDPRTALAPHVYETSCLAYKGLLRDGEDQSILVSGESGAGKTETVKILLHNLASIQQGGTKAGGTSGGGAGRQQTPPQDNVIVQRVLDSNPLLEAFGNATTLRNDNSSRFGKYLQLQFDTRWSGASSSTAAAPAILAGSRCEVYLLEKSRVTHHHGSERTYHIFYQLLAAPEELKVAIWDGLADTDAESFCYVGRTEGDPRAAPAAAGVIEGRTDAERFQLTLQALELIGVRGDSLRTLLRAVCVVLLLGNLEFSPGSSPPSAEAAAGAGGVPVHRAPGGDADASEVSSVEELQDLSELMGMADVEDGVGAPSTALRRALTVRNVEARGEVFAVPLTPEKAKESADAFAKEIYAKTFLWLVRTINDATCAERNYRRSDSPRSASGPAPASYGIIGLLDIFGFESFEVNRFEQLCINYCNEKLQQKFTQDIFRSVQVEYENEGIQLDEITYEHRRFGPGRGQDGPARISERGVCSSQGERQDVRVQGAGDEQGQPLLLPRQARRRHRVRNLPLRGQGGIRRRQLCRQEHGHPAQRPVGLRQAVKQRYHRQRIDQ